REEIAREKAGIMRIDAPVICADPDPPAAISECAVSAGSKLIQLGMDFHYSTGTECWLWEGQWEARSGLTLPGQSHLDNIAGALAALELLGWLPDVTTLNRVFDSWKLSGRLQVVPGEVEWWLDVAHNEGSVRALVRALTHNPESGNCICIIGLLADKPAAAMLTALLPCVTEWIVVALDTSRAIPATEIADELYRQGVRKVSVMHSVAAGCAVARARSKAGDRVVVTGSFHTVGPAMAWLGL
ncbi:MAG: bifunctional folylpolyglutamate synthase/dihydrofolate synthase, partial [Gammaproteobacteria bacterium]|nr:bifunctional folylpolyglutamate synthase/dihydrofolate synthase [Gammaproteobacteria bacterium]